MTPVLSISPRLIPPVDVRLFCLKSAKGYQLEFLFSQEMPLGMGKRLAAARNYRFTAGISISLQMES